MTKKIKLMHYQLDGEICVVDYNDLKVSYYGNNGDHYNLLGAVSDRIEAFLMRRKWKENLIKINMKQFKKRYAYQLVTKNLKEKGVIPFSAREYTIDNVTGIINKFEYKKKDYFSMYEEEVLKEWISVKNKLIEEHEKSREKIAIN